MTFKLLHTCFLVNNNTLIPQNFDIVLLIMLFVFNRCCVRWRTLVYQGPCFELKDCNQTCIDRKFPDGGICEQHAPGKPWDCHYIKNWFREKTFDL